MRLTAIILLAACLSASANGKAQTVSLSLRNASIEKAFAEIKKQTGYEFLYTAKLLEVAGPVTVEVKNASLEKAMELTLKGQSLTYTIVDKTIIVKPVEKKDSHSVIPDTDPESFPPIDIKGRILNETGEPVLASVVVKGTNKGTTTNSDGYFELKGVDDDATLVITASNIETREIKLNGRSDLDIVSVKMKVESLNEVVINKGYYTEKQKLSVGNVGKVTGKEIEKQPVQNVLYALQGRIPGLLITQKSGITGGAVSVSVQGQNSISYGSDPLYIIDGVPFFSQLQGTGVDNILGTSSTGAFFNRGNPLSYLNTSDIESIEVLKDADATAIYGSRAANGAILITTKKGKAGKVKFESNVQTGWGSVGHYVDMLNRRQYLDMRYEALKNDGLIASKNPNATAPFIYAPDLTIWDTTRETNWQKYLIGNTAKFTNISSGLSGGTEIAQYLVNITYRKEGTVFPGDLSDEKFALHFNMNTQSSNKKLQFQIFGNYLIDNNLLPSVDLTSRAINMEPIAPPVFNSDGTLNWIPNSSGTSTWSNPVVPAIYTTYKSNTNNLIANSVLSYKLMHALNAKCNFGYTNILTRDFTPTPILSIRPENRTSTLRSASYGERYATNWIIEPQLEYSKSLRNNKFSALLGGTIQQNNSNSEFLSGSGHNSDQVLNDIKAAASVSVVQTSDAIYKYNAVFGRLNYNYLDKYIINLTARRDGSSRFGAKNQFHNFWSAGGAWLFTEEKFMKDLSQFLSFGKLKVSYGTTGNDQITDYGYLSLYSVVSSDVPYQNTTGSELQNLPNPYLQWEETRKFQAGIDLGLLRDRVNISVVYVNNRSSNQLLAYTLPMTTGYQSIIDNFPAAVENTNWEFVVSSKLVQRKNVSWTSNINFTIPRNKLLEFPNLATSTYANSLIKGQPLNIIKAYKFAGVNPQTGTYMFFNTKGEAVNSPTSQDQTKLINLLPKYYGGVSSSIGIKKFQVDFLFQFVNQSGKRFFFNNTTTNAPGVFTSGASNQPVSILEHWTRPGDEILIRRYTTNVSASRTQLTQVNNSDAGYTDASFIRFKTVSVSWTLPENLAKKIFNYVRVYVQGQNLLTITKYKGLDPETQAINSLPPLRMFTAGVQFSL